MSSAAVTSLLILAVVTAPVQEATTPVPPKIFDEALKVRWTSDLRRWDTLTGKIVVMARDFPEDRIAFQY